MLRYSILFGLVLATLITYAQQTAGRAVYEKSTAIKIDPTKTDPSKQLMLADLPKSFDTRAELFFSSEESLYQDLVPEPVAKPEGPPSSKPRITFKTGTPERYHFDPNTGRCQQLRSVLDRQFTVKDDAIPFEWKETGRTGIDEITGLPTREATAVHPDGDTILVQYTPSVALPYGPEEYHGLPGLIVHLRKNKVTYQLQDLALLDEAPDMPLPVIEGKVLTRQKLEVLRERKLQALIDGSSSKRTTVLEN